MRPNSKEKVKTQTKTIDPLLILPQSKIHIYTDRIQICNFSPQISSINSLQTNPTLSQITQTYQSISFNQSDLVFKLLQKDKKISISTIYNYQKPFLQIYIENNQQRQTLHHILKKKWCEAGFEQQYQKLQEIGKGAMSKVFMISRISDGKKFAAKIVSLKTQSQKSYDTFINQTKILRVLTSPYVVGLEGVYISQKKQLISVLEYLNGGTLFMQLKQNKLKSPRDKLKALKDVTLGLEHLRQKRIVHRDLKLQNIMIRVLQNGQKQYVITDFGLSNWIGQKRILYQKCGTPGYLAPEILNEKKGVCLLTHATDIFSLGVIYHYIYMRSGVFHFDGCTIKLLELNKKGQYSLKLTQKSLHELQFALIQKTLSFDPDTRPTSKQLLQKYIPCLEYYIERKFGKIMRQNKLITQSKVTNQQYSSIGRQQQKLPSYKKKSITVTEASKQKHKQNHNNPVQSQQQQSKKSSRVLISSAKKLVISAVNRISSSFSRQKKQKLKPKDKISNRQQMKNYISQ